MAEYQICKKISKFDECIKLDLNEFDFEHHPDVYKSISSNVMNKKTITHYSNIYNSVTETLIDELTSFHSIKGQNLILTAGSDDALEYVINRYVNKRVNVFLFKPSYSYFEVCIKRRTEHIYSIPLDFNNKSRNIGDCLEFYREKLEDSVVYIVNPNNPLGTIFEKDDIEKVLKEYPDTMFILDEAYMEFCEEKSCKSLIRDYKNIVVTRTFSKAYGLAGMRLGYLMAHTQTADNIRLLYNEKNTIELTKRAGLSVMKNIGYYNDIIKEVKMIKKEFESFLEKHEMYYVKSYANFVSFYVGENSGEFLKKLEEANIYIRDRTYLTDMQGFVRITIGNSYNMRIVMNEMEKLIHLVNKSPINKYYTPKDHIWRLKLLFKEVVEVLNQVKIEYWLDSGSLLGYKRHDGIIPWDDDIDIGIIEEDTKLLKPELFEKRGLRLKKNRTDCYLQVDFIKDIPLEQPKHITNDIHIDIFPFVREGNKLYNIDPRFKSNEKTRCNFIYTDEVLYPLKDYKFYGIVNTKIPNKSIEILDENILSDYKNVACIEREKRYEFNLPKNPSYA